MGVVGALLPLAAVAIIIALVIRARRRDDVAVEANRGDAGTLRRLFLYGIGLLALIFSGIGLSLLIGGALDAVSGDTVIAENDTELAIALSFSMVGIPGWLIAATLAQRWVRHARGSEAGSEIRRWYLDLASGIALAIVGLNGISVVQIILGVSDFDGSPCGWLIVWGGICLIHNGVLLTEPPTSRTASIDRLYLSFGAIFGLALLLSGTGAALSSVFSAAYDGLFRSSLVAPDWTEQLREAIAPFAVGAAVWSTHWVLRLRRHDAAGVAWQVVVYLFGVLPGVALTLVNVGIVLHSLLEWWFGTPSATTAAEHYAALPNAMSIAIVGLGTWAYFRSALRASQRGELVRSDPERIYRYLVTAVALVVVAAGMVAGLALAVDAVTPGGPTILRDADWWRDQLVLATTLLAVGVPVWAFYWADVRRSLTDRPEEQTALPRRLYLFAIFGVASIVLLVNLTIVLFNFFDAMLGNGLTSDVLRDSRWSLALALSAGVAAVYHWLVLREDQPAYALTRTRGRRPVRDVILLAPNGAEAVAEGLAGLPDVRVRVWRRLPEPTGRVIVPFGQPDMLRAEVDASTNGCLVIVSETGDFEIERFMAPDTIDA